MKKEITFTGKSRAKLRLHTLMYALLLSMVVGTNIVAGPTYTNQGNGTKVQLSTGTTTANNCVKFDANGNTVDAGAACGSGGGGTAGSGTLNYAQNGITATAGTYYAPIGGGGVPSATEANVNVKAPAAMTVANLQVNLSAAPGTGNSLAVTLRLGGASQTVTCTISDSATSCQDLTHSVVISTNDLIDWQIVTTGSIAGTPTITIASTSGAVYAGATVLVPGSYYTSDSTGKLFPNFYAGSGGNASATEAGWGVIASLSADVALQMRFQMPSVIPPGTFKLVSYCLSDATSGTYKYTISDANVNSGSSPSAASLTSETQNSVTATAAGIYMVSKTTLTSVPAAGGVSVVAATFNTSGWTLAQPLTCRFVEVWE